TALDDPTPVPILFCEAAPPAALDPEAPRRLSPRLFERAAATIEAHGGSVEKFVGDELLAVFGLPVVREDDALRAVRAAVALREHAKELGAQLDVRIGVN